MAQPLRVDSVNLKIPIFRRNAHQPVADASADEHCPAAVIPNGGGERVNFFLSKRHYNKNSADSYKLIAVSWIDKHQLMLEPVLQVFLEGIHANTFLLPGVAVTDRYGMVFESLVINSDAER